MQNYIEFLDKVIQILGRVFIISALLTGVIFIFTGVISLVALL